MSYLCEFLFMISFALVENGGLWRFIPRCGVSAGQPPVLPGSWPSTTVVIVAGLVFRRPNRQGGRMLTLVLLQNPGRGHDRGGLHGDGGRRGGNGLVLLGQWRWGRGRAHVAGLTGGGVGSGAVPDTLAS